MLIALALAAMPVMGECYVEPTRILCNAASASVLLQHYAQATGVHLTVRGPCERHRFSVYVDPALVIRVLTMEHVAKVSHKGGLEIVTCKPLT